MTNSDTQTNRPADRAPGLLLAVAVGALLAIFAWVYARFASSLYFGMDDFIESEAALAQPLLHVVRDAFTGALTWSGYRPVAYSLRAVMVHLFGVQDVTGYYVVGMGMHLLNTLLVFHLVWRVARRVIPAFLAALFFLLLPAHNEAVLYMSANANLFALCFVLLAFEAGITPALQEREGGHVPGAAHWLWGVLAAGAYLLAMLTYEVTLPAIVMLLLADWRIASAAEGFGLRAFLRRRAWLYGALTAAAALALGMRFWASSGLGAQRDDYSISLLPDHLLHGYGQFLSQLVLLMNSPWKHLPDYVYTREWMDVTNPRALASMALIGVATVAVLGMAVRRPAETARLRHAPCWVGWGLLWVVAMALPFVALSGRAPENRYTYIPSFGAAVAVGALFVLLFRRVARYPWRRWGEIALMLLAVIWFGFYGWVTTSDVAEFARAGAHARAFLTAMDSLPLQGVASVAQAGVPFDVGSAYVFATDEALAAALRLHGVDADAAVHSGDMAIRALAEDENARDTLLIGYDRTAQTAQPVAGALLCAQAAAPTTCRHLTFSAVGETQSPWLYTQVYNVQDATAGGIGMLVATNSGEPTLLSCWQFVDLTLVQVDPSTFDNAAVAARCQADFVQLLPQLASLNAKLP